jgi:hypothetical protein
VEQFRLADSASADEHPDYRSWIGKKVIQRLQVRVPATQRLLEIEQPRDARFKRREDSCTCSMQTSKGFDGSDTNSSIPQGFSSGLSGISDPAMNPMIKTTASETSSERRSAFCAASRSGRRSRKVELMKSLIVRFLPQLVRCRIGDVHFEHRIRTTRRKCH